MPVGNVFADVPSEHHIGAIPVVGLQSNWVVLCTAPHQAESDSGVVVGGKVVRPGAITRTTQNTLHLSVAATRLLLALEYNADVGTPTSPIVRVFGRDGAKSGRRWHALATASAAHEITIAVATTTDTVSDDGTRKVTQPVEVQLDGSMEVIAGIQTAFAAGTGTASDAKLIAKVVGNR
jgi:hypothetical protein